MTLTRRNAVAVVTLDRPPVNAIDEDALGALNAVREQIDGDPAIRAVVLLGSGRAFCAGVDINMIGGFLAQPDGRESMLAFIRRIQTFFTQWRALRVPTVAALRGSATGGGLELALSSDLRVANEEARFGLTEVKIGLLPGAGGTQLLSRVAGVATATRLILTGDLVTGAEAARLGIVHASAPEDAVESLAFEWAEQLATRSPSALREIKRCLALAPSDAGLAAEIDGSSRILAEPATRDLVNSFFARS